MKQVELNVKERGSFGSAEARRMRKMGIIPGVFYGGGKDSIPLEVESTMLKKALGRERGNVIINLSIEGKEGSIPTILKDYQSDPLGRGLLHVDFMEIQLDKPIEASIRLELTGSAFGVREGGVMDQTLREVLVRCLPADMPDSIDYDVEEMDIGDSIRVSDLVAPAGVEILDDEESAVASIIPPTILKEEPTEEELEAELEEGEEGEAVEGEEGEAAEAGEGEAEAPSGEGEE